MNGKQVFLAFYKVHHLNIHLETEENHESSRSVRLQPVTLLILKPGYLPLEHRRYTLHRIRLQVPHKKISQQANGIQARESRAGRPEYKAGLVITLPCRSVRNNLVEVESNPRLPGAMSCSLLSRVW
jgi:hypothetical protein